MSDIAQHLLQRVRVNSLHRPSVLAREFLNPSKSRIIAAFG